MKKLLYCAVALAGLFAAASCQQESLEPVQETGAVTFTVEAPAAMQTKATIADGTNVEHLIYEVWLTPTLGSLDGAQRLYQNNTATLDLVDGVRKTKVTLDLVNDQKFAVLFWAQVDDPTSSDRAYNTDQLTAVTYAQSEYNSNDESLAAFYAVAYVVDGSHVKKDGTGTTGAVKLTRPFAQLNLGTLNTSTEYTVALVNSEVTVYDANTTFNVATSEASAPKDLTFKMEAVPSDPKTLTVNEKAYEYAGMNYLFAGTSNTVSYKIATEIGASKMSGEVTNTIDYVPLQENYRTNIIGNLLTSRTDYDIVVDAAFNAPEIVIGEDWTHNGSYNYTVNSGASTTALEEILAHADEQARLATKALSDIVVTIDLASDVEWETGSAIGSTPLLPDDSPISKVVLNGNGKNFTATGAGVGPIRLANGGLLEFNEVNIIDKSVSYAEDAWEFTYLEFAGKLAFNECTFNSGVQFESEGLEAVFTKCRFITNEESVYAAWISDGTATFTGCTFEGTRGLKAHEDYGSEVVSVTVDGCTFGPLSKKPGIALGVLNADTEFIIKDSKFDRCQAGDQNNYMYESDTDVTVFAFVLENNTVIPSGDDVVEQEDGSAVVTGNVALNSAIEEGYATIRLAEGTYIIPDAAQGKTLKFVGLGNPEDTKIATQDDGSYEGCDYSLDGSTVAFENITINTDSRTYTGYARCNGTYKNCVINGTYTLYGASAFESCTFNVSGDVYNIWTWGAPTATFTDCTFNSDGKAMLLYGTVDTELTIDNCVFNDKGGLADLKAAIEIGNDYGKSYTLVVNNTTVNGYEVNDKGIVTGTTLWANKNSMSPEKLAVTIDGLVWIGGLLYADADGNVIVNSAAALTQAAQTAPKGTTNVKFANDIVGDATILQRDGVNLVVNGDDKKYNGVITVNGDGRASGTETLTFKNINFDAATATENFTFINAPSKIGDKYNYSHNVTIEDCTFTGNYPAVEVGSASFTGTYNLVMKKCTVTKMHSALQVQSCDNTALVENVTATNCKNGVSFGNTAYPTIKNSSIGSIEYGIRADGNASRGNLVVENTAITSKVPVIVRKITTDGYKVALDASTVLDASGPYSVVFTKGSDDAAYVAPEKEYEITGAEAYYVYPLEVTENETYDVSNGVLADAILSAGGNVELTEDVTASASETTANSGYGATGLQVSNGAVLDGKGNTLTVTNANGTWDCAVNAKGGTIKNLTVNGAFRGIFMGAADGDVYIDNVVIDKVCYTFNSDGGSKEFGVYISNSTLNGWTSHSDVHKEVVYTNCNFGRGTGGYKYAYCRPYGTTRFVGCEFEAGYQIEPLGAVTFENCTLDGIALTAENLATLVISHITNATVK